MMGKPHLFLLLFSGDAVAHTWLEALRSITSNGSFSPTLGYSRGFVARNDPSFSDNAMVHKILTKDSTTPLCHPNQQVANGYSDPRFPRLNVSAGSWIALTYQENGHVSQPQVPEGRPYRSGNVYVYASTSQRDERFYEVHRNWTAENSLESGRLIASHFFDDNMCFQNQGVSPSPINAHRKAAANDLSSVNCQTDVQIPEDIDADGLVLYWVWDWTLWPNMPKSSVEFYTACAEVHVLRGGTVSHAIVVDESIPEDQRAIQSQLATQHEVFDLGTGTAAPPSATAFPSSTPSLTSTTSLTSSTSLASSTIGATSSEVPPTTSPTTPIVAHGLPAVTTVYQPCSTVFVTVTPSAA